jgi:hypothetical protein
MTSNSNSTWSPPQLGFQLKRIPYPWTHLGSNLAHPSLDSSLLELKALIPLWPWTPSQFGLVSSIFFLSSPGQLTRVTFTLTRTTYLIFIRAPYLNLTWSHQCLPSLIRPYSALYAHTRPYTILPDQITLPNLFLIGLLPTRSYPATKPDFLARPDNTSLHPTAYLALPNHLAWSGTLQLASPKNILISIPPWLMLILTDNASR